MTTHIRSAFWIPVFDELADPRVVARLAGEEVDAQVRRSSTRTR